jgi:bla regulator protein BlaR1
MSLSGMLEALARASLQGALFVAVVWIVCRLFPRLPAAVRCGLWWAACLKMLLGLVPLPAVPLPLLPAAETVETRSLYIEDVAPSRTLTPGPSPFPSLPPSQGEGKEEEAKKMDWKEMGAMGLVSVWLAGLGFLGFRALGQLRHTRGVIRRAEPLREGWVRAAFAEICGRLGLRRAPGLRGSGEVRTPQVTGLAQPVVLIPRSGFERLTPAEVSMTLCHELVHLRRKDLWLGWVPALAQRIFFFHPLAALAAREYAIAREAACDAEVLRVLGSAPQAYGRLLLRWGVAPRETGLAAAGASPSLQNLKRRLQMLQQNSHDKRRFSGWWWLAGAAILIGLAPLRIVAQDRAPQAGEAAPAPEAAATPEAPEVPGTPVVAPAPEATPAPAALPGTPAPPVHGVPGVKGVHARRMAPPVPPAPAALPATPVAAPAAPAVAPGAPTPAVAPLPPRAPRAALATPRPGIAPRALPGEPATPATPRPAVAPRAVPAPVARMAGLTPPPAPPAPPRPPAPPKPPKHSGYSYHVGDHGDSWVILYGDSDSVTMSGDTDELQKVKRLRGDSKDGLLWFRQDGKEYVVRDQSLIKRAQGLFEAQAKLGARQGELGARQGALGGKQGALGAQQGALGAQLGTLAAERARRGDDGNDRDLEKRGKELDRKMDELGRQQEELGRQQEVLGRQQEELGRQQEELGQKAEKELHSLMGEAIRNGVAQEVR